MFSDLPQHELDKLCTVGPLSSDSFVFSSHGYDLHIDNELVADAFANLPEQEQSILILYWRTGYGRWRDRQPHRDVP